MRIARGRFSGRPPELKDASESGLSLMGFVRNTKFTLAFSNCVSPNPQTLQHVSALPDGGPMRVPSVLSSPAFPPQRIFDVALLTRGPA
jgi:hypothetical protein